MLGMSAGHDRLFALAAQPMRRVEERLEFAGATIHDPAKRSLYVEGRYNFRDRRGSLHPLSTVTFCGPFQRFFAFICWRGRPSGNSNVEDNSLII
jgi:hypothetical protein